MLVEEIFDIQLQFIEERSMDNSIVFLAKRIAQFLLGRRCVQPLWRLVENLDVKLIPDGNFSLLRMSELYLIAIVTAKMITVDALSGNSSTTIVGLEVLPKSKCASDDT